MATKLPLVILTFFLSVSTILASFPDAAAAHASDEGTYVGLDTQVPYYMYFHGGVAVPAKVGNQECPTAVALTKDPETRVQIVFDIWDSTGRSVPINDTTNVIIAFNFTDCNPQRPSIIWGHQYGTISDVLDVELVSAGEPYAWSFYRIQKVGGFYKLYAHLEQDLQEKVYNTVIRQDTENGFIRLASSTESPALPFSFVKADQYDDGLIKSVV